MVFINMMKQTSQGKVINRILGNLSFTLPNPEDFSDGATNEFDFLNDSTKCFNVWEICVVQ